MQRQSYKLNFAGQNIYIRNWCPPKELECYSTYREVVSQDFYSALFSHCI